MKSPIHMLLAATAIGVAMYGLAFAQEAPTAPEASAQEATLPPPTSGDVRTDAGPVSGIEQGGMMAYLGIPYAAPPVGDLRWRPPQPPEPWTATRKGTTFASDCAQNADLGVFGKAGGTEDCLYLNVFAAQGARPDAKRPVLVWLHGGSLWVGSGRDYDASKLAVEGGAIVVTVNYRLGLFGLFAHPAIDDEGHDFANYGFMDQQAALDWVQRNIERFGGDPANVTISGESSGGTAVLGHVASPRSAGKFQHAIAMSGGAVALSPGNFGAPFDLADARASGSAFAAAVGCTERSADCMRALPTKRILDEQTPFLINQMIIDGTTFPERPSEAFKSGRFNRVTLINGNTRNEGTFFTAFRESLVGTTLTESDYASAMSVYFRKLTPKVVDAYPLKDYANPTDIYATAVTDYLFACSGLAMTRWASQYMPVYAYEFSDGTAPSYLAQTTYPLLSAHTFELSYLFPGFHGGDGTTVKLNSLQ